MKFKFIVYYHFLFITDLSFYANYFICMFTSDQGHFFLFYYSLSQIANLVFQE